MTTARQRVLLLNPPYADYTYPYHSLGYVAAPLMAAGWEVDILDINALWFRSVFRSERLRHWADEIQSELDDYECRERLTIEQQTRYVTLLQALATCRKLQPEVAVNTLRSEDFYDIQAYYRARAQVRAFERLLNCVGDLLSG